MCSGRDAGAGRRAFTSGHVLPCAVFSAPRAVLSVLTVKFVVECCLLSLLSSVLSVECRRVIYGVTRICRVGYRVSVYILIDRIRR